MSKDRNMSNRNVEQNEEMETRLVLLESLIQTKNKEIESFQEKICGYKRLKEDFMNSQHKLIALQTKFEKVSAENQKLKRQLKSLSVNHSEDKKSYSKTKHLKLSNKISQTTSEDFHESGFKWYDVTCDKHNLKTNEHSPESEVDKNREYDVATELVREVTEAASKVAREQYLNSMAYEETSGLYYDYKTGYYFDAERSLFYDGNR